MKPRSSERTTKNYQVAVHCQLVKHVFLHSRRSVDHSSRGGQVPERSRRERTEFERALRAHTATAWCELGNVTSRVRATSYLVHTCMSATMRRLTSRRPQAPHESTRSETRCPIWSLPSARLSVFNEAQTLCNSLEFPSRDRGVQLLATGPNYLFVVLFC